MVRILLCSESIIQQLLYKQMGSIVTYAFEDQIMNKPPSDAYTYHLKGELDSHKNPLDGTCPRRMLPDLESWQECTLGCHMLVKRRLAIQHRSKECPRRLVTCRVTKNETLL